MKLISMRNVAKFLVFDFFRGVAEHITKGAIGIHDAAMFINHRNAYLI